MKIEENEFHEPSIGISPQVGFCISAAKCSVCDCVLAFERGKNRKEAKDKIWDVIPNCCPHCGARLKENA